MPNAVSLSRQDRAMLVGDGFLITLGTMTVALAVPFGLPLVIGEKAMSGVVAGLASVLLLFAGGILGVVLTWLLHARRIDLVTVLGAIVGSAIGGALVPAVAGISFLLGLPLRLVTDSEYAGPLALLALISVAVVALIAWLLADAMRDLAGPHAHVKVDYARVAAAVVFLVLVGISVYLIWAQPGPEQGEAPIWAIAAGLSGASVIAGADVANAIRDRSKRPAPTATP